MQTRTLIARTFCFLIIGFICSTTQAQTADEIIEKHLLALGGKSKLEKIRGMRQKQKVTIQSAGIEIETTLTLSLPGLRRTEVHTSSFIPGSIEILNGDQGVKFERGVKSALNAKKIKYLKDDLSDFPSPLLNRVVQFLRREEYNGKPCFVLERKDGNKYWVEAGDYMLIKSETGIYHEQVGNINITTTYSHFKEVSGIIYPYAKQILDFDQRIEVIELEINPAIPEGYFDTMSVPLLDKVASEAQVTISDKLLSPEKIAEEEYQKTGSYYAAIQAMLAAEALYKADPMFKGFYYEMLATNLSIAGNTLDALKTMDKTHAARANAPEPIDFEQNHPVKALDEIEEVATRYQAIFINEAHHVPQHRAFTHQLLERLYKKGYRYFAVETLMPEDTSLIRQKDFVTAYINEPEYADLIRTAISIGYKIIPYEATEEVIFGEEAEEPGKIMDINESNHKKRIEQREIGQATNLKERIFDKDPAAKVLVHAGYDHIIEKQHSGFYMMAYRFRELTGIDPLTVDQVDMMEKGSLGVSSGYYQYLMNELAPREYRALKKSDGTYWTTEARKGKMDMQVFHPRVSFEKGRPTWKALAGKRKLVSLSLEHATLGIAEAYVQGEKDGVPMDRIYLDKPTKEISFYLPQGVFQLKITNETGQLVHEEVIKLQN